MAVASGQVITNIGNQNYFWVRWQQTKDQDIVNNKTPIDWQVGVYTARSYYLNAIQMSPVTINGTQVYNGGTYSNYSKGDHTIASGSLDIPHDTDGKKKFKISVFTGWLYPSNNYSSEEEEFELKTIPRASSISATDANIGSTSTVMINRASDSFTHTVEYNFEGLVGLIATKTKETTIPFDIPTSFFEKMSEAQSGTVTLICYTFSGDTLVGTKQGSLNVQVPSSGNYDARPLIDSATARDINPNTLALTGNDPTRLVTYKSNVKISVTGRCIYHGAFKVLRSSQTQIPATTSSENGTTTVSGSITHNACDKTSFLVFLGDKRGLYKEQPLNEANGDFKIVPYIPLTMSVEAKRVSPTSNSTKLNFTGNFYNGYYDEAKSNFNDLTIKWRYKLRDSGSWITTGADDTTNGWHNLTLNKDFKYNQNKNTYSSINDVIIEDIFDYQEDYTIEIQYADRLSSYTTPQPILAGIPNHDYGKDANGKNYFNVNGNIYCDNKNIFDLVYPIGSIYLTLEDTNPSIKFGGTWEKISQGRCLIGAGSANDSPNNTDWAGELNNEGYGFWAGEKGGQFKHKLTLDELTSHDHAITYPNADGSYGNYAIAGCEPANTNMTWAAEMCVTQTAGGDQPHNIMQPYLAVNIWQRTA